MKKMQLQFNQFQVAEGYRSHLCPYSFAVPSGSVSNTVLACPCSSWGTFPDLYLTLWGWHQEPGCYSWERDVWRDRKSKHQDAVCGSWWLTGSVHLSESQTPPWLGLVQRVDDPVINSTNSFCQHPTLPTAEPAPTTHVPPSNFHLLLRDRLWSLIRSLKPSFINSIHVHWYKNNELKLSYMFVELFIYPKSCFNTWKTDLNIFKHRSISTQKHNNHLDNHFKWPWQLLQNWWVKL